MNHDPDRANQDKPQSHQAQTDKGAVVHPGDCQGNTADDGALNEVLNRVRNLKNAKGRYNTQLAYDHLMSSLPENQQTTPKQ